MGSKKSNINVKYTCLGASKQVTGSCHQLSIYVNDENYNLVIDCGMVQNGLKKMNELYELNKSKKSLNWENVSAMVLSHSHS